MTRARKLRRSDRAERKSAAAEWRCILGVVASLVITLAAHPQQPSDDNNPYFAAAVVYARVTTFTSWQKYCAKEDPSSAEAFSVAVDSWLERHARLHDKTLQIVLSAFTKDELAALDANVRSDGEAFQSEMASLRREERISWCRSTATAILSPRMSLLGRAQLVAALENFGAEN